MSPIVGLIVGFLGGPTAGGIVATALVLTGIVSVWIGATMRAPFKQRNEALKRVGETVGDDVSIARARLEQSQLIDSDGKIVTGFQVFTVIAESLLLGMDNRFIPMTLTEHFKDTGGWNHDELGRFGLRSLVREEVVEVEHRPGAVPDNRGLYKGALAGPHDIYRLSPLGRQLYRLIKP